MRRKKRRMGGSQIRQKIEDWKKKKCWEGGMNGCGGAWKTKTKTKREERKML